MKLASPPSPSPQSYQTVSSLFEAKGYYPGQSQHVCIHLVEAGAVYSETTQAFCGKQEINMKGNGAFIAAKATLTKIFSWR